MKKNDEILRKSFLRKYRRVLKHRQKCPKWTKEFCLECFGGGLRKFSEDFTGIEDIDR